MGRILFCVLTISLLISCSTYKKDEKGITLNLKNNGDNAAKVLRLDVMSNDIVHVQEYPVSTITPKKSLILDDSLNLPEVQWQVSEKGDSITLTTESLEVQVSKSTGKIKFSHNGMVKLAESASNIKTFIPAKIDSEKLYSIRKVFNSPGDEAFYGLGQHQDGVVNYKGKDVDIIQHNLVAVVPFIVSNKNYGILWDNYSHSKFGDPRDYQPVSMLKLYDEKGDTGALTATYYTDLTKKQVFTTRRENNIYYKYLSNLKQFPKGFDLGKGMVEWKGFIEPDQSGKYKFLVYSAGYLKVWLNDSLIIDCWRQGWNPWERKFRFNLVAGEKLPVRMEWIPDANESFISFECLSPLPQNEQENLSLYSEAAREVDYYFINGNNIDDVIKGYRTITGKAPIMPNWAMGLWQSRERYKTQKELLDVVKEYRYRKIPLDNIVLDWHYWSEDKWGDHGFDYTRFPNPKGMIDELHNELHAHLMISVWAKYYEGTKNYKTMKDSGWLYMQNIKNRQKDWVGPGYVSTFYDAYNAGARKEFWKEINDSLFSKGVDGWWLDATEPDILSNTSIEKRKKLNGPTALGPSAGYFNTYSLMQAKGVYEGQRSTDPDKRVFILTRSAFAGQQRYAAATWSGDVASRWGDLKDQVAGGVNMCVSGIPYWTTDIGGFALEKRYEHPNAADLKEWRELNLRWYQFGVFCPLFRIHGQFPYREIFNVSPEGSPVYNSMVYYDGLRYRLMPYIYSLAGLTYLDGYTIMRPLVMDFESDVDVLSINDEFMFGPDLLVCPVYKYKARKREVYLPAPCNWYDLLTGEYYKGGMHYSVKAPLYKIPVFVKEGAILPVGPVMQYVNEKLPEKITIYVFGGADGNFTLYEDEGTNYDYEKGLFSTIGFSYNNADKKLTISNRNGQFPGMLKERQFIIKLVSENTGGSIDDDKIEGQTIRYNGLKTEVKLTQQ